MSKRKTKKAVMKRIKITKNGKVVAYPSKKGHLRVEKSAGKRRKHRKPMVIGGQIGRNIRELTGG